MGRINCTERQIRISILRVLLGYVNLLLVFFWYATNYGDPLQNTKVTLIA